MFDPALLDDFDDLARIEIDTKTNAAAKLAQMLHRQPQPPRARRAEHEPVSPFGEEFVGQGCAEHLVVDTEIIDDDAAFGYAGRTAGLEDVGRLVPERLGKPAPHRPAAEPVILEQSESF